MAEDDDEERKRYDYLTLADPAFERYCLAQFDLNDDDRLSRYEAERVIEIDCSQQGIATLDELDEFPNLQRLNCSGNRLLRLDVEQNRLLSELRCGANGLEELSIDGVRALVLLHCEENQLTRIDLGSAVNLQRLDASKNRLTVIDLASCSTSLTASLRDNPALVMIYIRKGQQVDYNSPAELIER